MKPVSTLITHGNLNKSERGSVAHRTSFLFWEINHEESSNTTLRI